MQIFAVDYKKLTRCQKIKKSVVVKNPAEKQKVFDKDSPYLPIRKIGKNNLKEKEIRIDNYLRQEWNNMVDRAVVEGVTEEELCMTKKTERADQVKDGVGQ